MLRYIVVELKRSRMKAYGWITGKRLSNLYQ